MKEKFYKIILASILFLTAHFSFAQNKPKTDSTILSDSAVLTGVTVTARKPIIVNTPEKIVYNAANDITTQGGVALDILKKVPQVDVDIDGNVELQGNSNIRFLINGKPSSAFGNSLTDALASIPASDIQSIEVMTTPGAQYDAQGTGGVINILLKSSKVRGWNGNVNLSSGTRLQNGSIGLNYRHDDFSLHAFFNGNAQLRSKTPFKQSRTSFDANGNETLLDQTGYNNFIRNGYQAGIGTDWNWDKKNSINAGFTLQHFYSRSIGETDISQTVWDNTQSVNTMSTRNSLSRNSSDIYEWEVGYTHQFDKSGETLTALYNASYGNPKGYSELTQFYNGILTPYRGSIVNNPGKDQQNYLSLDYVNPITSKFQLETGIKGSWQHITSASDIQFYQPTTQLYLRDASQSYNMQYQMNVYAAYVAGNYSFGKIMDIHAGVRYEYTDRKMDYENVHLNSYGTFVPSVILSHKINSNSSIKLAYTRRLERPEYKELNPYLDVSDPYNMTTGNPLLQPEIGNNFELGYSNNLNGKGNLYIAAIERINSNDVKPYTTYYDSYSFGDSIYQNVSISNRMNVGKEYNTGAIITSSINLGKLSLRENAMLFVRHMINSYDGGQITNSFNWRINLNMSYQWSDDLVSEVFGNYRSSFKAIQGKVPQQFTYTIALRKQFWNKNASIGLTATNPFNKYVNQTTTIVTNNYNSYYLRQVPYQSFGISFTYKFGKLDVKKNKDQENYLNSAPEMGN